MLDEVISLYEEMLFKLKTEEWGSTLKAGREGWGVAGCKAGEQGEGAHPGGKGLNKHVQMDHKNEFGFHSKCERIPLDGFKQGDVWNNE